MAEPRTVSTRFGSKTQVVTLTVGDPTRAPFRIDAWLEIRPKSVDAMELKAVVRELRIQDVIVVKNLRLGVWNNAVFGTTWRVGSRGGSALWLVHRLRWGGSDERCRWRRRWDEAVLAERKVANMIKWVKALVGSRPGLGMNGRVLREEEEQLPEDSREIRASFETSARISTYLSIYLSIYRSIYLSIYDTATQRKKHCSQQLSSAVHPALICTNPRPPLFQFPLSVAVELGVLSGALPGHLHNAHLLQTPSLDTPID